MSSTAQFVITTVTRQLRLTLLAATGLGAFVLLLDLPAAASPTHGIAFFELLKLLLLSGLPVMLLMQRGPKCDSLQRTLARLLAILFCAGAFAHSVLSGSPTWQLMMVFAAIVTGLVQLLDYQDSRNPCT